MLNQQLENEINVTIFNRKEFCRRLEKIKGYEKTILTILNNRLEAYIRNVIAIEAENKQLKIENEKLKNGAAESSNEGSSSSSEEEQGLARTANKLEVF